MRRSLQWLLGLLLFALIVSQLWLNSVKWLFLCEVQWVAGVFLLALPILSWKGAPALVRGAYEIETKGDGFNLSLLLMLAASSIIWTAQIELGLARIRLHEPIGSTCFPNGIGLSLLGLAVLLNLIATHVVSNGPGNGKLGERSWSPVDSGMLLGLIVGVIGFLVSELLIWWVKNNLGAALPQPVAGLMRGLQHDLQWLPSVFKDGYIGNDGNLTAESTHLSATVLLVATSVLYIAFRGRPLTPLCSLGLLTIALVWLLSGFAFFFQVFRIPASLPLFVWLWLSSRHPKADHFYEIKPVVGEKGPDLPDLSFLRQTGPEKRILVVAAAGGGIQASAWTAQVLCGLKEACDSNTPQIFENSLRAVSGVSGGSVGLMYFLAAQARAISNVKEAAHAAAQSSLSEVTHALAYEDLGRAFCPFLVQQIFLDRGQALEEAWIGNASPNDGYADELREATLSSWTKATAELKLPAVIFNSTIVEEGQRLAFSTVPLPTKPGFAGFCEFTALYPQSDISISTAARLSAAFTFVSPAARPGTIERRKELQKMFSTPSPVSNNENLHLVDGGYLDNSGITGLIQLLHPNLIDLRRSASVSLPAKILVILIDAFPLPKQQYVKPHRGTFFQFWAPLLTLFTVRSAAHDAMAQRELTLFKEALGNIELSWIDFRFGTAIQRTNNEDLATEPPPLSWHLTKIQQKSITDAWQVMMPKTQQVLDFLKTGAMPPANFDSTHEIAPTKLTIGQYVTVTIAAKPFNNWTGVWLETGAVYNLSATGTWCDAGRSSGPDGYRNGTFIQNLACWLRRSPHSNWFILLGVTQREQVPFAIGAHTTYHASCEGELICFVNDVPGFYWNNTGSVSLTIRRLS